MQDCWRHGAETVAVGSKTSVPFTCGLATSDPVASYRKYYVWTTSIEDVEGGCRLACSSWAAAVSAALSSVE